MSEELINYSEGRLVIPVGYLGSTDSVESVIVIENFVNEQDIDQAYEYAMSADMTYDGGPGSKLQDRVHESNKFENDNPTIFKTFKEKYSLQIKNLLEEKHSIRLVGSKCTELHKPLSESLQDRVNYLAISSKCGCKSEINPFIVSWTEGSDQKEHTDNGNDFTAIIYLNDNYQGGELNFPSLDLSIKPKSGSLIIWPGYMTHSISTVVSGTRYTMPIFFKAISVLSE
jgi:hypothetical protein